MKIIGSVALVLAAVSTVIAGVIANRMFADDAWAVFGGFAVAGFLAIMLSAVITDMFGDDYGWHVFGAIIYGVVGAVIAGCCVSAVDPNVTYYVGNPAQAIWGAYGFGLAVCVISSLVQCIAEDW